MSDDTNVIPMAQPDQAAMGLHLNHLFDGFLDGAHDGLIELAWTDAQDGRLRHAEMFHTDDLDKIAERAGEINSTPGQNVYIGAALRKPSTFPGSRAEDEDYYCSTAYYADLDDEGAADLVKSKYRGCMPTMAVVTGRTPYTRVQLWWRLETPERDPDLHRAQCLALAIELGGDRTVVNPSRVMRLGGSIAWPRKAGRVIERTEVIPFKDGRPLMMMPGQLAKAYPPMQPMPSPAQAAVNSLLTGRLRPSALIAACLRGDQWHNHMVKLVAHWIGRGWSDDEILSTAAGLTLPGYTVQQTAQEMTTAIKGARLKWAKPSVEQEFDAETGEVIKPEQRKLTILGLDDIEGLQPPTYVIDDLVTEFGFTLVYGAPASFKSFLTLDWLLCMAYGKPWCGREVLPKTVLYIAGEGVGGIKKRVRAWREEHDLLGQSAPFYMLRHGINFTSKQDIEDLLSAAVAMDIGFGYIAVDTVARAMVGADEKDAMAMGLFIEACDRLREHFKCGLAAVHHTGKDASLGARGSSALPAAVDTEIMVERAEGTMAMAMKVKKQKDDEEGVDRYFEAVKIDLPPDGIKPVSSLVLRAKDQMPAEPGLTKNQVNEMLREVDRAWNDGKPWSNKVQSKRDGRWLPKWISGTFGVSAQQAIAYVEDLLFNEFMTIETVDKHAKKTGLKVLKYH